MTDLLRDCANLYPLILEAALRALLAAAVVWAGLRLLRVANVVVMKAAWALVLVASIALPLTPGLRNVPAWAALRLPAAPASSVLRQTNVNPAAESMVPAQSAPAIAAAPMADAAIERFSSPAISDEHYGSTRATVIENPHVNGAIVEGASDPQPSTVSAATKTPAAPVISVATNPNRFLNRAAAFCLLLYVAVALALCLRLLFGVATAIRIWMTAWPVSILMDPTWSVRASLRVASPVNIGSGIVLPAEYGEWDEEKLRIVVAHERSHIRQGDFYLQLLAGLYASVFWFSPLGWWLKRKLNELGEAISDRAGLEEAASRATYAQILLEFAALPRPTLTGVAMARTSHLSQRIERLLNESSFRQAFAGSGRRAILAVVLVPIALLTATSLVSVQAATPSVQTQPAAVTAQATPEQVTEATPAAAPAPAAAQEPAATTAPSPVPAPARAPEAMPAPPVPAAMPDMGAMPPLSGVPDTPVHVEVGPIVVNPHVRIHPQFAAMPPMPPDAFRFNDRGFAFAYGFGQDGDPYAVVGSDGKTMPHGRFFRGDDEDQAEVDKARKQAHGAFLWFKHDGKSYIVDDPSVVSQIEAMNKPMEDLQSQMRDLGKQMRELGEQQREKAKAMRDSGVQTPDLSKEIAALKAAEASLQAKQGGTITQKEIGDLQRELGKAMGELGSLQGKLMMDQGGFGKAMGEFGQQQGKLGGQMGKLGSEIGRIAKENHEKVKSIIDESLTNGKAKQVQ